VGNYKSDALQNLQQCADLLNQQIQLWQYIAIFAGERAEQNPIGDQVRGRIAFYSRMLSNIQHNIDVIQSAGPSAQITITGEESVIDLADQISHFKALDARQVSDLGLDRLISCKRPGKYILPIDICS
jgi:hypothetical protein